MPKILSILYYKILVLGVNAHKINAVFGKGGKKKNELTYIHVNLETFSVVICTKIVLLYAISFVDNVHNVTKKLKIFTQIR